MADNMLAAFTPEMQLSRKLEGISCLRRASDVMSITSIPEGLSITRLQKQR